mmetsp:Transcript_30258/g.55593  ORF Transcript_30258/g.55593 Transcript_30258/m.55593 type:complete len:269 (+) Transcript_30258:114-920(+)|eukprot:CAMPEP_0201644344 /NCGR_PEP_ID=MMETSP0493-20130528/30036_1 /ASSEMBLY_ACC=CAM_ASM_000838 /TAXON_ID=420259 /ORGANISM="Thalassiosira gravida, Strain GMp14c1" /LENGTH=268 /DNA_ID=CAMNT_0048119017 /DNA_START=92 /DNA_END=898 /DNA_ORIENTATION=-
MASITRSPIRAPIIANSMEGGKWSRSRKRRPIDPEETGSVPSAPYGQPNAKRPRTIDDVLGALSLRASDPPGNSFCFKRKSEDIGMENGPSAKVARSSVTSASSSSIMDEQSKQIAVGQQLDPEGRKGGSPTNASWEPFNSSTSCVQPNNGLVPTISASGINVDINDTARDDISHDSDSSVSESSIRNAMYQLVFGRRNPPLPRSISAGGGCGQYDAVDSKIEDIIRRSRLQAIIKSHKKERNEDAASDMDMDADITNGDGEWHPGHG